ncbi:MAG: Gfo/Idh/MocA family oxidoreductase [Myxococcales bacterium]|nr:Gfo/Idh/MocA family oxidoreductase [Deltaproteobacteria bacterium]NNL24662.1 Gfo/Idh/MocA family oxidoreductase [Myxococcales bacterium]
MVRSATTMPDVLRLGILGAARIAPFAVIKHARSLDSAEVVAVAEEYHPDEHLQRYAKRYGIPSTYRSFDGLLANPNIDAVYVPLPIGMHADWCIKAIEAGKHVLCEKPFAANAKEVERVLRVADGTSLVVAEAMHFRYHPLVHRVRDILRSGEIGAIESLDASFCAYWPFTDFRFNYETGGGGTIDMGCYPIGFIRAVTEEEPVVREATAGLYGTLIDRWMRAKMELPAGGQVRLLVSMRSRHVFSLSIKIRGSRGSIRVFNYVKPEVGHRLTVRSNAGVRRERVPGGSTYRAQLKAFVDAVRGRTQPVTTVADSLKNMRVIDAVYRAAGLPVRGDEAVLARLRGEKGTR